MSRETLIISIYFTGRLVIVPQAKNGEALPSGPRAQRDPQTPSKAAAEGGGGEREEAEQKALLAVQCSLLKILSKTLATLQHFTPDCCQIILDQVRITLSLKLYLHCLNRDSYHTHDSISSIF